MKHLLVKPIKSRNSQKGKVKAYYGEACFWSDCWTCSDKCGGCTGACNVNCDFTCVLACYGQSG